MKNLKNNLSNNNNSVTRKTYIKAISLASLSSLIMSLVVNDIQKANAMVGPVKAPNIFYGSNGSRPITGVHTGNSGVKAVPNAGNLTTTPGGNVVTTTSNPAVKNILNRSLSVGTAIPSKNKVSISTQTSNLGTGLKTNTATTSTGTGTGSIKTFKDASTQTGPYNGSIFHGDLGNIETASNSSKVSKVSKGSLGNHSIKTTTTNSDSDSSIVQNNKLTTKQKLAIGAGAAGLATLGLGLGLGLGLNNNSKDDSQNKVTPPDTVPVPEAPPVYSTLITQSSNGNLFIDENVDGNANN